MKRKVPIFELEDGRSANDPDGWRSFYLVARNQENIGVIVHSVSTKKKEALTVSYSDSLDTTRDGMGGYNRKNPIPRLRKTTVNQKLNPKGTERTRHAPGDTEYIWLITSNVETIADLTVDWSWADGQKR